MLTKTESGRKLHLPQSDLTPSRSVDELVALSGKNQVEAVASSLSDEELNACLLAVVEEKAIKRASEARAKAIQALLLAHAKLNKWRERKYRGHKAAASPSSKYAVDAYPVITYILRQVRLGGISKDEGKKIINAVLSVNLTEGRRYLGQKALDDAGGNTESIEYARLTVT
jgi:hypothetical protein